MESSKSGGSSHIPFFDGSDFGYWKARMRAYLKSIDERVWYSIETGYTAPVVSTTVDNKPIQIAKPRENWEETDYKNLGWNSKAIHAIFLGVSRDEFHRISRCEIGKEAWEILETTHEGTTSVKRAKLQLLTTKFEMERMKDDESFDEFNARLSDIVNSCHGLGEPILESKVVRKILRSLPIVLLQKLQQLKRAKMWIK